MNYKMIMKNEQFKVQSVIIQELPEGMKKFMKDFRQDRCLLDQDWNPDHPEQEAEFGSLNSTIQY
jgi:hypothetical protein